jgi:hypothetical protein
MSSPASYLFTRSVKKVENASKNLLTPDELKEYTPTDGDLAILFREWFAVRHSEYRGEKGVYETALKKNENVLKEMMLMLNQRRKYTEVCEEIWNDLEEQGQDGHFHKVNCGFCGINCFEDIPSYLNDIYELSSKDGYYASPAEQFVIACIAEEVAFKICEYLNETVEDKLREIRDIRQLITAEQGDGVEVDGVCVECGRKGKYLKYPEDEDPDWICPDCED